MSQELGEQLKAEVLKNKYFYELFSRLEELAAKKLFGINGINDALNHTEYADLLRFADILSHSSEAEARNKAYKIITLMVDSSIINTSFRSYAEAILAKLGNFPGLNYLQTKYGGETPLPLEREVERQYKIATQKTADNEFILTDAQYSIVKNIDKHDYYSFSGPTSIGKTFIIRNYIYKLTKEAALENSCAIILVPTRALIGQLADEIRRQIKDSDVNVATFPSISKYIRSRYNSHIFVFTPERLLSYVSSEDAINIKYLFVDEAQKVVAIDDSRSSLYYHSIYESVRKFATKIIFASPNIPNPEIFLGIFEKDRQGVFATSEQTVSQNRYFVDLIENELSYFSEFGDKESLDISNTLLPRSSYALVEKIGKNDNNIIYCNTPTETVERALKFAQQRVEISDDKELENLISFIGQYVHRDYYLIECLKKGVAFHHGRMPQRIRKEIENIFAKRDSALKFMFCTSTLLEGVNLPAKNIFVVNDSHGSHHFKKIDFENLIGRAGRLTKEFSGNVICVRDDSRRWHNEEKLISRSRLPEVESFLTDKNPRHTKEYRNISKALTGQPLATNLRSGERENINHYASIMLLHQIEDEGSILRTGFLKKDKEARGLLQSIEKMNRVPARILRLSSTIKPIYQNRALDYITTKNDTSMGDDILGLLKTLYSLYAWGIEESSGKDPLIPAALYKSGYGEQRLNYWAMLMRNWIKGEPFSKMVGHSIYYYRQRGEIWFTENGRPTSENFVANPKQINIIIEQLMNDIENGLRFKIKGYLLNYYLLQKEVHGTGGAGVNYAELVEYGTTNSQEIELQNIGLSRGAANILINNHADHFFFNEDGELQEINLRTLKRVLDNTNEYYGEITNVLNIDIGQSVY